MTSGSGAENSGAEKSTVAVAREAIFTGPIPN
jgi:hypothetical protein